LILPQRFLVLTVQQHYQLANDMLVVELVFELRALEATIKSALNGCYGNLLCHEDDRTFFHQSLGSYIVNIIGQRLVMFIREFKVLIAG